MSSCVEAGGADRLLAGRKFEFPVERAVFVSVLHRITVSGSDRACERWMADYDIPGAEGLGLHHFYRAMAWLGGKRCFCLLSHLPRRE